MRSPYNGETVLNAGDTFLKWAGYHGFIVDKGLATEAAWWEARNSWWRKHGDRCLCYLCE